MKSTSIRKFVTKILAKTRNAARRAFTRSSTKRRYEEAERVEKELIEALETQTDLDMSLLSVDFQMAIEKEIKAVHKTNAFTFGLVPAKRETLQKLLLFDVRHTRGDQR